MGWRLHEQDGNYMKRLICRVIPVCFVIVSGAGPAPQSGGGTIVGEIGGPVDFSVSPAVCTLPGIGDLRMGGRDSLATVDQKELSFIPHVLVIEVGTTVRFLNNDVVLHNIFSPSRVGDQFNLGTYQKGVEKFLKFDKPGEIILLCNVHPEMEAYILVVDTPFYSKTDNNGNFTITGVPPGEYTLNVWHPHFDEKTVRVIVEEGRTVNVKITLQ